MNIYDIAQRANVSIATVSRVLNGKHNVSEKTKNRVMEVIKELDYTPNIFARGLGLNSINVVGLMVSDISDLYYANAVSFIERELRKFGYDSILCSTSDTYDSKKKYIDILLSKRVDAMFLIGSKFIEKKDNSHITNAAQQIPVIIINGLIDDANVYSVLCDDFEATYKCVKMLTDKSINNIVYLYDTQTFSGMQKLAGYKQAMVDAGLPVNPKLIIKTTRNICDARNTINTLINEKTNFSAVVCSEDILAVGAVKAAIDNGIKIPEQLSIIGFNNSVLSKCCIPEITSVDNNLESLCITGVRTMVDVLDGKSVPNKIVVSAQIIKRDTTNV